MQLTVTSETTCEVKNNTTLSILNLAFHWSTRKKLYLVNLVITTVPYEHPAYAASAWQTGSPEHINHLSIVWALKASRHIILRLT